MQFLKERQNNSREKQRKRRRLQTCGPQAAAHDGHTRLRRQANNTRIEDRSRRIPTQLSRPPPSPKDTLERKSIKKRVNPQEANSPARHTSPDQSTASENRRQGGFVADCEGSPGAFNTSLTSVYKQIRVDLTRSKESVRKLCPFSTKHDLEAL